MSLEIQPFEEICDYQTQVMPLHANYNGGIWGLRGYPQAHIDQDTQMLSISPLTNGEYSVDFFYTSNALCKYQTTRELMVHRLDTFSIMQTGSLCKEKNTLGLTKKIPAGAHYEWHYSPTIEGNETVLLQSDKDKLEIEKTGYYGIEVKYGECTLTSDLKRFVYVQSDSVFAPNVFTPNDDGVNEMFQVFSRDSNSPLDLMICNRFGKEIFSGDGTIGWDGGEAPPGVYYWIVSFQNCNNKRQQLKGYVQLVK